MGCGEGGHVHTHTNKPINNGDTPAYSVNRPPGCRGQWLLLVCGTCTGGGGGVRYVGRMVRVWTDYPVGPSVPWGQTKSMLVMSVPFVVGAACQQCSLDANLPVRVRAFAHLTPPPHPHPHPLVGRDPGAGTRGQGPYCSLWGCRVGVERAVIEGTIHGVV